MATDSNIGTLPNGSVVYSSSAKYAVSANKSTTGILKLLGNKGDAGVFRFSVLRTNNKQDISKLPVVRVLSNSQQNIKSQSNYPSNNIYGLEIDANNATLGKYVIDPEFVSSNGSITKLNNLMLEVTSHTQNTVKGDLSVNLDSTLQYATITLSNSVNVSNLQVNIRIGNQIYKTCQLSSGFPNNFCIKTIPPLHDLDQTQNKLSIVATAAGYTTVSKKFASHGYLSLHVNHLVWANSQKNTITVKLEGSEDVRSLPVIVSFDNPTPEVVGLSNNQCTLSTAHNECQVDLYVTNSSNDPQTIKAYVPDDVADRGAYVPATDTIVIASGILAGTNDGFTYLNGTMIKGNGANGTVDSSSIRLVNIDTNGHIYAGTANGYVYNSPNTNASNVYSANGWQKYNNRQFKVIAMDISGNVAGVAPDNRIYVQNGGYLYAYFSNGKNTVLQVHTDDYGTLSASAPSYQYNIPMAFWGNTPYFAGSAANQANYPNSCTNCIVGFGTDLNNAVGYGHNLVDIENFVNEYAFSRGINFISTNINAGGYSSISTCNPSGSAVTTINSVISSDRIYAGYGSGKVVSCGIEAYGTNPTIDIPGFNGNPQHYGIMVNSLVQDAQDYGKVPDSTAINSLSVDNETIYAATAGGHIYYYNEANPTNWIMLGGGTAPHNATITSIVINGGKLFASAGDSIYIVSDNGWEKVFSTQGDQINGIATVPSL